MSTTAKTILWVVVIILILLGIYYWTTSSPQTYNVEEPETNIVVNNNTAGVPVVTTRDASFISQSTAILNGDINPNGVQTSYWYEYGSTEALGSFTPPQLVGGGYVVYGAPGAVVGLKSNTFYYYRLTAQNQYGKVYGAVSSFKTTTTPPAKYYPPSVQTKNSTAVLTTTATLNGSVNGNGSNTFYWFEYGENLTLGSTTPIVQVKSGSSTMDISAGISSLKSNTTYYYRLNAQNAYGTANGNIFVFTTAPTNPPPTPVGNAPVSITDLATNVATSSATLNGQVNPNGATTTYHFEYGKSTLFGLFTLDEKTDNFSAGSGKTLTKIAKNITNLDSESTYYFQLIAENQYGTTRGSVYSFTTKK